MIQFLFVAGVIKADFEEYTVRQGDRGIKVDQSKEFDYSERLMCEPCHPDYCESFSQGRGCALINTCKLYRDATRKVI
jgi:hypothetical protein